MASTYTLNFSDPSKSNKITITGPIKNNYDTSLDLVGPGYVNYGETIAQDFLRLLENFASPNAPINPIEGQLWYDTSNPGRKVLRVNNGSATSARWPSANGIYQQANDPSIEYNQLLIDGDVWVDTGNTQVKIRYGNTWTLVGPGVSTGDAKTGSESINLVSNTGETYPVILNWVNGKVVEIISYNTFTPRTVIDGFSSLTPGINLTTKVSAKFNGLADRAKTLEISNGVYVQASEVLKNVWPTSQRQLLAGSLIVESAQGLFIRRPNQTNKEIKIGTSTGTSVGLVEYGYPTGSLKVGVTDRAYIYFNGDTRRVGINTFNNTSTLTVNGDAHINGEIYANGDLSITGSAEIVGHTSLLGNLNVYGTTEISTSSNLVVGNIIPANLTRSIGSEDSPFESVYVRNIGNSSTFVRIFGTVSSAEELETRRDFQLTGQLTSNLIKFNGTASVILVTTATSSLISSQETTTSTTSSQTLLVLNTATGSTTGLEKISKASFLADVYPGLISTGMVIAYVSPGPYNGWIFCDGAEYITSGYIGLYGVIGDKYSTGTVVTPGFFRVPNLTTSTLSGTNGHPIYYHIKT